MNHLHAILLGLLQGLTEFLPISSTAHLILARAVFGWNAEGFGLPFDVALHLGTLVAILWYFRAEARTLVAGLPAILTPSRLPRAAAVAPAAPVDAGASAPFAGDRTEAARLDRLLMLATIPIIIVGWRWGGAIEHSLRTPWTIVWTMG